MIIDDDLSIGEVRVSRRVTIRGVGNRESAVAGAVGVMLVGVILLEGLCCNCGRRRLVA